MFQPSLPEDIERTITEVVLDDATDMAGTMSLVASRFHAWTKPLTFHTVIVRRHDNWMQRISDCILPNASFIRILVLDLPFTQDEVRLQSSAEELSIIRQLLEACGRVRHLAVTWNIWAHLERECGVLELKSLYLIWDGAYFHSNAPSFLHLTHPAALQDLTISAPADLENPTPFRLRGQLYLPVWTQAWRKSFLNFAYVTYASDRLPRPGVCDSNLKWTILVVVREEKPYDIEERELQKYRDEYSNHSTVLMQDWSQVLDGWVAKIEGRESLLTPGRTDSD
ncbi:hypothetical protein B0H19DRAFT_1067675 [Mycena capillaripes]|nr:hypothetical protein B0H19DRAFT_1067675 [Mycena capillaripes]